ncbi:uncharacterized protein BCR38DRAFT_410336 [Pseudomassariella vexata]|uniref:Uncharacterized protein n=1 Tax=Pseudomassariella vexata TaxID=1141098 RepID=A0A1Y2DVW9_9PEZI|nr:uncharacterized protein BCR38DRAFT_410336 [Pseudomassariella vexata]ORY63408.1 hypothetical protein BCR38DRAFT_410336 [Pseudomassariella vexata]
MVSLKTFVAATLVALPSVSAYLVGMTAPSIAAAGSTITATFDVAIYIQNWQDFSIIWGLSTIDPRSCPDTICLGTQITYNTIYPDNPDPGNYNIDVKIPATQAKGNYTLVAAVPYLVGASGMTDIRNFTSAITIT